MSEELLDLYNRELAWFRNLSREFALKHPKIAGRLRLNELAPDPHVERLIEGFAYLNARVRLKIEDEFPELCKAMLNVLYPEYCSPYPSCSIVRFELRKSQFELTSGYVLPKKTRLSTQEIDGEPCRFRTCYPVETWPFTLESASVKTPPYKVPPTQLAIEAKALVRLELKMFSDQVAFKQLGMQKLRVFLNGDTRYVHDLYELIMNNATGVVLASSDHDQNPVTLDSSCLTPVGFENSELLMDYAAQSRLGYHLLTEFFVFPSKFMFVDINGIDTVLSRVGGGSNLCIYIFLDQTRQNLENLPKSTFVLGATPVINLFEQRCEPIRLRASRSEYCVYPDARHPLANEVGRINRVTATGPDGQRRELLPFYSANHPTQQEPACFWISERRPSETAGGHSRNMDDLGSEVFIRVIGIDAASMTQNFEDWTVDVEATCFNRDYPNRLPQSTQMTVETGGSMVESQVVIYPSMTARPELHDEAYWRLISHLSLNHISLADNTSNTQSIREILRLYNFCNRSVCDAMIDGLVDLKARRVVGRIGQGLTAGFCRGTELELTLNQEKFSGGGHFLFGTVLDHFFALYSTINSFTKTVLKLQRQEQPVCSWPLRTGDSSHV